MAKNLVTLNLDNTDYSFRPQSSCTTAANVVEKIVNITGFELCTGATILVRFTNSNIVTNPTINVNNTGAKPVVCLGHKFDSNIYYEFIYNGSSWVQISEEKYRCSLSSGNKNNFPWHRIAYTDVLSTSYIRRSIVLILNQAVFGGRYGELVIKVSSNTTDTLSSYEAYWIVNKGFGANDIKIGVNNTYGNTYFDVFYKCPSTWSNLLIEQKTGGYDSNFSKSFTLCSSQEVSDTTTADRLNSIECYLTIEDAAIELHNTAYTHIITPGQSSGTIGVIQFNGNAASATNSLNSDKLDGYDSTYFATKEEHDNLVSQIQALSLGMKLTSSVSPSTVYKNTNYKFTFTGTLTNPANSAIESMVVKDDSTVYNMSSTEGQTNGSKNKYTYTMQNDVSLTSNKSYTISARANGMDFISTVTVSARNAVYYGMGSSASDVKTNGTKASARTTAISSTTYDTTATANGVRFYLLVPNDVTKPTSFTMGGAPVDMASTTTTLDGISYNVFYTNATYNSGASVQIKAN